MEPPKWDPPPPTVNPPAPDARNPAHQKRPPPSHRKCLHHFVFPPNPEVSSPRKYPSLHRKRTPDPVNAYPIRKRLPPGSALSHSRKCPPPAPEALPPLRGAELLLEDVLQFLHHFVGADGDEAPVGLQELVQDACGPSLSAALINALISARRAPPPPLHSWIQRESMAPSLMNQCWGGQRAGGEALISSRN